MKSHRPTEARARQAVREEVLEELWTAREAGELVTEARLPSTIRVGASGRWPAIVREPVESGLVAKDAGRLRLAQAGEATASMVVRRHRLAETLFHHVLALPMETTESEACKIEHILSPLTTDALCSFLGHPPVCPHGRPIPTGECCATFTQRVEPLILRLVDIKPGERGVVVLLAPKHPESLDQLTDLGVVPGAVVAPCKRKPSLVIEVDSTTLAIEDEIAEGIYLRP